MPQAHPISKVENDGTLSYLKKITAHDKTAEDRFGISFHFEKDNLAVGADLQAYGNEPYAGSVYNHDVSGYVHGPEVLDNTNFQTAVNLWFSDRMAALLTYGHIRTGM